MGPMVCCTLGSVGDGLGPCYLGWSWLTEHSVKYSPDAAAALAAQTGWRIQRRWTDPHHQVALHLLLPAN